MIATAQIGKQIIIAHSESNSLAQRKEKDKKKKENNFESNYS